MDTVSKIFRVKAPVVYKSAEKPVECSNPELVMGMELETENASDDVYHYEGRISKAWRVDRDGSLRGPGAYEFISHPLPMETLIPELTSFFKYTKFDEHNYTDRCSIHVHTNVTNYTQDMLASLSMVYAIMEDVLFQFVNHYKCPIKEGYNRDTGVYCVPWNQCRMNHRLVERMFQGGKGVARWQKYTSLNLLPIATQGTVEWRHMHGTADMEKLTIWLNLIGSIMSYARRTPLDDVVKTVRTLNDTSAYRQFFLDVLKGHLSFEDHYAASLAEGVVNAKCSLADWDRNKKAEVAPTTTEEGEEDGPIAQVVARIRAQEAQMRAERDRNAIRRAEAGTEPPRPRTLRDPFAARISTGRMPPALPQGGTAQPQGINVWFEEGLVHPAPPLGQNVPRNWVFTGDAEVVTQPQQPINPEEF